MLKIRHHFSDPPDVLGEEDVFVYEGPCIPWFESVILGTESSLPIRVREVYVFRMKPDKFRRISTNTRHTLVVPFGGDMTLTTVRKLGPSKRIDYKISPSELLWISSVLGQTSSIIVGSESPITVVVVYVESNVLHTVHTDNTSTMFRGMLYDLMSIDIDDWDPA